MARLREDRRAPKEATRIAGGERHPSRVWDLGKYDGDAAPAVVMARLVPAV